VVLQCWPTSIPQDVKWDPTKKSTTSQQDHETRALVEEDLFNIGTDWKLVAPIRQTKAARPHQDKNYTVENLLQSRSNGNEVHSFASIYGRHHDGNSIATEKPVDTTMAETETQIIVQIDPNTTIERPANEDARSYDASTAGYTTGTTHELLHEQQRLVARLLEENRELEHARSDQDDDQTIKTTKSHQRQTGRSTSTN
jgi:hypothetical protein